MNWIESPESSTIARYGYDDTNQGLFVEFKNGSVYQYFDVPQSVFEQMGAASSKGQFLAQIIKGTFRYARM
jgi:KTSC domain